MPGDKDGGVIGIEELGVLEILHDHLLRSRTSSAPSDPLGNDTPGRVSVVAHDLGRNHVGKNKETVAR